MNIRRGLKRLALAGLGLITLGLVGLLLATLPPVLCGRVFDGDRMVDACFEPGPWRNMLAVLVTFEVPLIGGAVAAACWVARGFRKCKDEREGWRSVTPGEGERP